MDLNILNWAFGITEILTVISIFLVITVPSIGFLIRRRRILLNLYEAIWKNSTKLKPEDILGKRALLKNGFHKYYFGRKTLDKIIEQEIRKGRNILITGHPLSGKSRAVFQALIDTDKPYSVLIPKVTDINSKDFRKPFNLKFWRKRIIVIDDLDKYLNKKDFDYLLNEFSGHKNKNELIIATCRTGKNAKKVPDNVLAYFDKEILIPSLPERDAKIVAKRTGRVLPDWFDKNIGTIFLDLEEMTKIYESLAKEERRILDSIKRLYLAGIYRGKELFSFKKIQLICKKVFELEIPNFKLEDYLKELNDSGLVIWKRNEIWVEETYLQYFIDRDVDTLANLRQMYDIFQHEPDTLFKIGHRAFRIGDVDLRKADFEKLAIKAYTKTLDFYTYDNKPESYGMTRNNLGAAYQKLAEIEDRATNCKLAIESFQEALKVHTFGRFQMDYAMTQNNLGAAYGTLAEDEDKEINCKLAIESYQEALKVYTIERFPIQYAVTRHNLGTAHSILAEDKDKEINCKLAIESYQEALKVRTVERFSIKYAMTQNNLGNAYDTLAEVEDKVTNCKLAIESFQEALKIYTFERFPMDYAMTLYNLGLVYITLAEDGKKESNCREARKCFDESLAYFRKLNITSHINKGEDTIRWLKEFCEGGQAD